MSKKKVTAIECELCGYQQIEKEKGDLEVLGLRIPRAFYAGPGGGGPIPKDTFVCDGCLYGTEDHGPALLSALVTLVFHDEEMRGPLNPDDLYAPKES